MNTSDYRFDLWLAQIFELDKTAAIWLLQQPIFWSEADLKAASCGYPIEEFSDWFLWIDTPHGHSYWDRIDDHLLFL